MTRIQLCTYINLSKQSAYEERESSDEKNKRTKHMSRTPKLVK